MARIETLTEGRGMLSFFNYYNVSFRSTHDAFIALLFDKRPNLSLTVR